MAAVNETTNGNGTQNSGGDAGVVTDAEILGELGLDENLQPIGAGAEESAESANDLDTEEGEEEEEEAGGENADDGNDETEEEEAEEAEDSEEEESEEEAEESEEEEEAESEEESEEEEEGEEEQEELPKSVRELQKRVNKLTRRAKTAEEERETFKSQVESLTARLEKAAPIVLQPGENDPLSDLMSEAAVQQHVAKLEQARNWYEDNPEGGEITLNGVTKTLDAKEVRQRLRAVERTIEKHAPARIEYLKQNAAYDGACRKVYPTLYKDGSRASQIANHFLTQVPEIMRLPNYMVIVGDAISGMIAREEAAKKGPKSKVQGPKSKGNGTAEEDGAGKSKLPTKKKVVRSVTASVPPRTTVKRKGASQLATKALATGRQEDLAAAIESGAF